jgi:hypothetical protein
LTLLSRFYVDMQVLLPESFRGGCSFGTGNPDSPCTHWLVIK